MYNNDLIVYWHRLFLIFLQLDYEPRLIISKIGIDLQRVYNRSLNNNELIIL
jgi:hypothetical protein